MELIKTVHVICALISISGFIARGLLMVKGSSLLTTRWVKISPHINDTVLLLSAIMLASQWGWSALQLNWLLAKITALIVYIILGSLALRPGHHRFVRITSWLAAIVVFAYIVSVAITKNPLVFS